MNQENIEKFATIFHHVKNLTNELNIDLNNGLSFQTLGTNHVCLVEMILIKIGLMNLNVVIRIVSAFNVKYFIQYCHV